VNAPIKSATRTEEQEESKRKRVPVREDVNLAFVTHVDIRERWRTAGVNTERRERACGGHSRGRGGSVKIAAGLPYIDYVDRIHRSDDRDVARHICRMYQTALATAHNYTCEPE